MALWSIPQDCSAGPNGFLAIFFHHSWDIIIMDLLDMTIEFFDGLPLSNLFGATNIVLLPKVEVLDNFAKFCSISLCSVVYKILSKIMVNFLAPLMGKFISKEQSAFLKG